MNEDSQQRWEAFGAMNEDSQQLWETFWETLTPTERTGMDRQLAFVAGVAIGRETLCFDMLKSLDERERIPCRTMESRDY